NFANARLLVGARVLYHCRRCCENRPGHGRAGESRGGPEEKVGLESGIEQELGTGRGLHRRRAARPRRISGGNHENHSATPVVVPQRKLHGGWRPGGGADNRRATDFERVKQAGMRVGLRLSRGVAWQRRAKVAEAGHGNDAETAVDQWLANLQPLVIAAAGAMRHQYRRTIAGERILNRAAGRLDDLAANRDALSRSMNIASVTDVDQPG